MITMNRQKSQLGQWTVEAIVDKDGLLTLSVSHEDRSKVLCLDVDTSTNETEWADRFTTKNMESDYLLQYEEDFMTRRECLLQDFEERLNECFSDEIEFRADIENKEVFIYEKKDPDFFAKFKDIECAILALNKLDYPKISRTAKMFNEQKVANYIIAFLQE